MNIEFIKVSLAVGAVLAQEQIDNLLVSELIKQRSGDRVGHHLVVYDGDSHEVLLVE